MLRRGRCLSFAGPYRAIELLEERAQAIDLGLPETRDQARLERGEVTIPAGAGGPPAVEDVMALAARHGIEFTGALP